MSFLTRALMSRAGRATSSAGLLVLAAVALSGCVSFNGMPVVTQIGDLGGVRVAATGCSNGDVGPGPNSDGGACAPAPGFAVQIRVLLAIQLPNELIVPATTSSTLDRPASVTHDDGSTESTTALQFARNASYESALAANNPPAAGYRWAGYVSERVVASAGVVTNGVGSIDFAATNAANGAIVTAAPNWTVGIARYSGALTSAPAATETIACTTNCIGVSATGSLTLRTLVVTAPAATTAQRATPVTVPFTARLDGGALPSGATLTAAATSSIAGATATVANLAPASGTTASAPVTLTVPANAPAGASTVTLKLTTASGETRTAVATVNVPEPAVVKPAPTAPDVTALKTLTSCVSTRFEGSVLTFTTSESVKATYLLQRRSPLKALLRKCPPRITGGAGAKPTFTTVARKAFAAFAPGRHAVRIAELKPEVHLKPGAYRLRVQLSRGDGTPGRLVTQSLIVLAP